MAARIIAITLDSGAGREDGEISFFEKVARAYNHNHISIAYLLYYVT